jgi:two-component system sensor histidine kinase/response regulator
MIDHISKPIDPGTLLETVGRFYKPLAPSIQNTAGPVQIGQTQTDLPEIPGLDLNDGLARVAGNKKLYLKLLNQFVEQHALAVEQIRNRLNAGETEVAERLAHTLKGVAANIGAKAVQACAGDLEKLIRARANPPEIEASTQELSRALPPVIAGIRKIDSPSAVPEEALRSVAPEESAKAEETLLKLLSDFDPAAAEFVENNRSALWPFLSGDRWSEFERLVQAYDFAAGEAYWKKNRSNCQF